MIRYMLFLCFVLGLHVQIAAQVTGSGTTNYIPRWTGATSLGNSALFQNGGTIGVGTITPSTNFRLQIDRGSVGGCVGCAATYEASSSSYFPTSSFIGGTSEHWGGYIKSNSYPKIAGSAGYANITGLGGVWGISTGGQAYGGDFVVNLNSPFVNTTGDFYIAGVNAVLSGTVNSYPTTNVISALYARDQINGATWAGYFDGRVHLTNSLHIGTKTHLPVFGNSQVNVSAVGNAWYAGYFSNNWNRAGNPSTAHGLWAEAIRGSNTNTGVTGFAMGRCDTYSFAYGVFGFAQDGKTNIGVYGATSNEVCTGTTDYAGYFNGTVAAVNYIAISDSIFKKEVKTVENSLENIMKLRPVTYTFDKEGKYNAIRFTNGLQHGFIAQEMEKVYPELVSENIHPANYNREGEKISEEFEYKGIAYTALIPELVSAIQEQQRQIENSMLIIEEQAKEISELKELVKNVTNYANNTSSSLDPSTGSEGSISTISQNYPNPFLVETTVDYFINPKTSHPAYLVITAVNNTVVSKIALSDKGKGSVTLRLSDISAGVYTYTLLVNDQVVDSKQFVKQ